MADYIDREKTEEAVQSLTIVDATVAAYAEAVLFILRRQPSADVAPVVHARWIWNPNGMDYGLGAWQCGQCFTRNNRLPMNSKMNSLMCSGSKQCPECGEKMDAKENDNEFD